MHAGDKLFTGHLHLRMVPPFVTPHVFCASPVWSKIFEFLKEFASNSIFARFMTMLEKQILARAIRTKRKIRGNPIFFRDN